MKGIYASLPLLFVLAFSPIVAEGKTFPAGFPGSSVWLSKAFPVAGEEIKVYATLYNSGDSALTGTLVFFVDDTALASKPISLSAGEAKIESATWSASSGEHSISAKIENSKGDDEALEIAGNVASPIKVSVAKPAEPSAIAQGVASAANLASEVVTAATPAVLGAATSFYEKTENFRTESAEKLEKYIASTESPVASSAQSSNGAVLGQATTSSGVSGFESPKKAGVVSQVSKAGAQIALFITKSKFFFYPLLLLLILFIISMLFKWASRRPV